MYQGRADCFHGRLQGILQKTPNLKMDEVGNYIASMIVCSEQDPSLFFTVYVYGQKALYIRQNGFIGLHLIIEGEFQYGNLIIAEKISVRDTSASGSSEYGLLSMCAHC